MSSTYERQQRQQNELHRLISSDDNERIIRCLESSISQGNARVEEKLLLGVLLLLPPVADYDAAAEMLDSLLGSHCAFEAAVWGAYKYGVLQPDGSRQFEPVLQAHPGSAVAHHLRSLVALADGNYESSILENRKSRKARPFPFNILIAVENDSSIEEGEKRHLTCVLNELVISRSAELDLRVSTVEGLLSRKWENLILGTRLTTQYWEVLGSKGITA